MSTSTVPDGNLTKRECAEARLDESRFLPNNGVFTCPEEREETLVITPDVLHFLPSGTESDNGAPFMPSLSNDRMAESTKQGFSCELGAQPWQADSLRHVRMNVCLPIHGCRRTGK
jgi:hypothetical protein